MKRLVCLMLLFYTASVEAQVSEDRLFVTYDKTVNLIFPYPIISEDHGSNGIIIRRDKNVPKILNVKANQKNFAPTNLSVITSDGHVYSFLVEYADDVYRLNYVMQPVDAVAATEVTHNTSVLDEQAEEVKMAPRNIHKRVSDDFSILQLRGLYITEEALWLNSKFINCTMVPYPVGFVKFFIRQRKRTKNSALQEREIFPIYSRTVELFAGKSAEDLLFAFEPFTIQKNHQLLMQIGELNGNRFTQIKIRPKHFRGIKRLASNN